METIIVLAPLVGALVAGLGWRAIGEKSAMALTTGLLFLACALSWLAYADFDGTTRHVVLARFLESGGVNVSWGIRFDRLTAIMMIVVTTVSSLVHLYSWGYMAHDPAFEENEPYKARFFAMLSFFTFMMLSLVTSDNLVQMFFGWEGVGLASYMLIGFYYKRNSAGAAAIKAFVVNRVGDFGFLLGMLAVFTATGSLWLDDIFAAAPALSERSFHFVGIDWNAANLIAFLLFIGAMGKSAQLFLHTWLPDAMEGPTPVSALIHAATMVTAGVFLVARMSPLYEFADETKTFIVLIGAVTAFFAATVGLVQNDIKRVIAYSTCSQLGYMFVAAGVGVYSVAMFHLLTHAFFKAMLFLSAGSVITAMHHEQDMRNYGGLRKKVPFTFWAMMIGTLAITGVGIPLTTIGFAGFLSKDAIVESAFGANANFAFWMLVIAAAFTAFYSWRLMFMTFFGTARGDQELHSHAKESPAVMLLPIGVLGVGAIFAGMVWNNTYFGDPAKVDSFFSMPSHEISASVATPAVAGTVAADAAPGTAAVAETATVPQGAIYMASDNHVLEAAHESPAWVKVSPFVAMVVGFAVAFVFYVTNPALPGKLARAMPALYRFLLNKWYFDELYDLLFTRTMKRSGQWLWKRVDEDVIDGAVNGLAFGVVPRLARFASRVQSGYLFHYAFAMVIGIVALMIWVVLTGGSH